MPPNKRVDDFLNKYGSTPTGKTAVGMNSGRPIYSDKTSGIDIEKERFASKYGAAPAGQDLIGMKSGKPVYGDATQTAGYKTPTPEEVSSVFQQLEDTKGYTPKPEIDLDKRKELASVLKQFARDEVKVNPEQMVKSGESMGVSRSQLSNLYQQYRKDFEANPPEDWLYVQNSKSTNTNQMADTNTGTSSPATRDISDEDRKLIYNSQAVQRGVSPLSRIISAGTSGRTETQGGYRSVLVRARDIGDKGPDRIPSTSTAQGGNRSALGSSPSTPRLDRLDAMQGTPMGSALIGASGVQGARGGLAKGPSRTGGTPIGGGNVGIGETPFGTRSSSARLMNNITRANLFIAGQDRAKAQEQQYQEDLERLARINAYISSSKPIDGEYEQQPFYFK